jgi:hypothetical protein
MLLAKNEALVRKLQLTGESPLRPNPVNNGLILKMARKIYGQLF